MLAISQDDITATEKSLNAFAWGTRGQFFWDGNKRTSLMLANKVQCNTWDYFINTIVLLCKCSIKDEAEGV